MTKDEITLYEWLVNHNIPQETKENGDIILLPTLEWYRETVDNLEKQIEQYKAEIEKLKVLQKVGADNDR